MSSIYHHLHSFFSHEGNAILYSSDVRIYSARVRVYKYSSQFKIFTSSHSSTIIWRVIDTLTHECNCTKMTIILNIFYRISSYKYMYIVYICDIHIYVPWSWNMWLDNSAWRYIYVRGSMTGAEWRTIGQVHRLRTILPNNSLVLYDYRVATTIVDKQTMPAGCILVVCFLMNNTYHTLIQTSLFIVGTIDATSENCFDFFIHLMSICIYLMHIR